MFNTSKPPHGNRNQIIKDVNWECWFYVGFGIVLNDGFDKMSLQTLSIQFSYSYLNHNTTMRSFFVLCVKDHKPGHVDFMLVFYVIFELWYRPDIVANTFNSVQLFISPSSYNRNVDFFLPSCTRVHKPGNFGFILVFVLFLHPVYYFCIQETSRTPAKLRGRHWKCWFYIGFCTFLKLWSRLNRDHKPGNVDFILVFVVFEAPGGSRAPPGRMKDCPGQIVSTQCPWQLVWKRCPGQASAKSRS